METETKELDPLDLFEHDPIAIAKSQRERIITRELARLPEEFHDKVLRQPLSELHRRVESAIKSFRIDQIDGALNDFSQTLRSAVSYEFANNLALRPWSARDEFARFTNKFFEERWDGNTLDGARALLKPNARILGVSLRQIETDAGPILRSEVIAHLLSQRPKFGDTISDDAFLSKFFTSENTLREIEKARAKEEHEKQNPVHRSGPPSIIGTPIPAEQR